MTHLYQTVDLGAAFHSRFPHGGPVNRRKTLNLDIVLDYGNSRLHNFVVRSIVPLGKSVAVSAHNNTILENNTISNSTVLADGRVRVRLRPPAVLGLLARELEVDSEAAVDPS